MKNKTMRTLMNKAADKPYIINKKEDKTVEINLYGEVVESVPIDWWTGEKVEGLYIELAGFLKELDNLKDATKITFHINSIGGDVAAGMSIYNRIRALDAETTTIVDGIAASAASVIAQAGDKRLVSLGTQTMIHGASAGLIGYYNVTDLNKVTKQLDSTNESIANIYANRSGKDTSEIKRMMNKETWMTADEAVTNGFADEVIGREAPMVAKIEGLSNALMINGVIQRFNNIPLPNMEAGDTIAIDKVSNGREPSDIELSTPTQKEAKLMNVQELKEAYPELVKEIQDEATKAACATNDEAVKAAVEADRNRIKEIDSIANMVGDPELVNKAKYTEPINASELALKAMQAQQAAGNSFLEARKAETAATNQITSAPNAGMEDQVAQEEAELNALVNKLKEV